LKSKESKSKEKAEKKKEKEKQTENPPPEEKKLEEDAENPPPEEKKSQEEAENPNGEDKIIEDKEDPPAKEEKVLEYHPSRYNEKDQDEKKEEGKQESKPSLTDIISSLGEKFSKIGDKVSEGKDKAGKIRDTLEEYQVLDLMELGKETLLSILNHIFPYYLKGWIRYGFDDPALTGYVAGLGAVFYPRYYKDFSLEPDFQRVCFAGYCKGKGRIRLGFFLVILIKLLLKKEVRRLVHLLLKR
ncbi:MAG: hypothetical protein IKX76_03885, partial [Eubacterium sp.]|nr:hypothetical protein [Eubacterium sp.]